MIIISVLSSIGVQTFSSLLHKNQQELAVDQLIQALHYARSLAVSAQQNVVVRAISNDWSQGEKVMIGDDVMHEFSLKKSIVHVVWRGSMKQKDGLYFTSLGSTEGQQGSFWISRDQQCVRLVLTHSGRVRKEVLNNMKSC